MNSDAAFSGSLPELYDRQLGPLFFLPYAEDMGARASALGARRVLELAAGTGIATEILSKQLPTRRLRQRTSTKAWLRSPHRGGACPGCAGPLQTRWHCRLRTAASILTSANSASCSFQTVCEHFVKRGACSNPAALFFLACGTASRPTMSHVSRSRGIVSRRPAAVYTADAARSRRPITDPERPS